MKNFALSKNNYILGIISILIIILGFALMTGASSSIENGFEPSIFSTRRIVVAPLVCLFGFLFMIYAILAPHKKQTEKEVTPID